MSGVYFYFINKLVCCLGESISNLRAESSLHSLNLVWFVMRNKAAIYQKPAAREPEHFRKISQNVPDSLQLLREQRRKSVLKGPPLCEPLVKEPVAAFQVFKCQSLVLDALTLNKADAFWCLRNISIFHWTKTSCFTSIHTWLEAWIYGLLS